jgi:hypothetical protein
LLWAAMGRLRGYAIRGCRAYGTRVLLAPLPSAEALG